MSQKSIKLLTILSALILFLTPFSIDTLSASSSSALVENSAFCQKATQFVDQILVTLPKLKSKFNANLSTADKYPYGSFIKKITDRTNDTINIAKSENVDTKTTQEDLVKLTEAFEKFKTQYKSKTEALFDTAQNSFSKAQKLTCGKSNGTYVQAFQEGRNLLRNLSLSERKQMLLSVYKTNLEAPIKTLFADLVELRKQIKTAVPSSSVSSSSKNLVQ